MVADVEYIENCLHDEVCMFICTEVNKQVNDHAHSGVECKVYTQHCNTLNIK